MIDDHYTFRNDILLNIQMTMDYEKDKEDRKKTWLDENSYKSQLLCNNILPMSPKIGSYIKVEDLEISEDFFKEEYDIINKTYSSVMKKMEEYYKNMI